MAAVSSCTRLSMNGFATKAGGKKQLCTYRTPSAYDPHPVDTALLDESVYHFTSQSNISTNTTCPIQNDHIYVCRDEL